MSVAKRTNTTHSQVLSSEWTLLIDNDALVELLPMMGGADRRERFRRV